jgi:hypothetical protein
VTTIDTSYQNRLGFWHKGRAEQVLSAIKAEAKERIDAELEAIGLCRAAREKLPALRVLLVEAQGASDGLAARAEAAELEVAKTAEALIRESSTPEAKEAKAGHAYQPKGWVEAEKAAGIAEFQLREATEAVRDNDRAIYNLATAIARLEAAAMPPELPMLSMLAVGKA